MPTETKRGRGRPRTRPTGAKRRVLYLTDDEFARVRAVASRAGAAGLPADEWMRRVVLAEADRAGR